MQQVITALGFVMAAILVCLIAIVAVAVVLAPAVASAFLFWHGQHLSAVCAGAFAVLWLISAGHLLALYGEGK